MKRLLPILCLIALTACNTPAPSGTNGAPSSPVSAGAWAALHTTQFPDDWKAIPENCGDRLACFFSPETYTGNNDAIDHDTFQVHTVYPEKCDEAYAQATISDGVDTLEEFSLFDITVGYTWTGYGGAGLITRETPTMRFVCVQHPTPGFDIVISSYSADTKTTEYLDNIFIPFWLYLHIPE